MPYPVPPGLVAFLPAAQKGMVAHENRLLSTVDELFDAQAVAYEDDHLTRELGSTAYDTSGLANVPQYQATQSSVDANWGGIIATYSGVAFATGGTAVQNTVSSSTGITFTVPASGYALGSLVTVAVQANVVGGGGTVQPTILTCTDSKGNSYTTAAGVAITVDDTTRTSPLVLFSSKLGTALVAGDTITVAVSVSAAVTIKGVVANFTGATSGSPDNVATGSGTTGTIVAGPTAPLTTVPQLLVGVAGVMQAGNTETITQGASFTEDLETTSAGTVDVSIAHRIDTVIPNIIGLFDWYSDVETTPAGTVSTTQGSTTVTGVGTTFTNHAPGDRIVIANETRFIATITSATVLDTTEAWRSTNAGATYKIRVGNRLITASSSGNLFKEKPLTLTTGNLDAVTLKAGLSLVARPGYFVAGGKEAAALNRKLFYFNGVDEVQVLSGDGTSTTDIANPPSDWDTATNEGRQPIAGVLHENRLVAWGNLNDPHRLYFSDPDDHEDFTTTVFNIRVRSDIGDRLFAGVSFQGVLFSWKYPRGIFYLDDTDPDTGNWNIRVKSQLVGCAPSPFAAVAMEDDVVFMAADGSIHLLSAVSDLGGVQASDLSKALGLSKFLRDNLNLEKLNQLVSVYHPHKKTAYFAVPRTGDVENTIVLKFDFGLVARGGPVRFSYDLHYAPGAIALRRSVTGGPETPILGESGFAYLMDQTARNKNGAGYLTSITWPNLDYGDLDVDLRWKRKIYDHLEFAFEPSGASGTATIQVYVDDVLKETFSVDVTKRRVKRALHVGEGYNIKFVLTQSAVNANFKLLGTWVYFRLGNAEPNSR